MAKNIPIKFEYKGKVYQGEFSQVAESGPNVFHLMIDHFCYGVLLLTEKDGRQFFGNSFEDMGDFFGDYVTARVGRIQLSS